MRPRSAVSCRLLCIFSSNWPFSTCRFLWQCFQGKEGWYEIGGDCEGRREEASVVIEGGSDRGMRRCGSAQERGYLVGDEKSTLVGMILQSGLSLMSESMFKVGWASDLSVIQLQIQLLKEQMQKLLALGKQGQIAFAKKRRIERIFILLFGQQKICLDGHLRGGFGSIQNLGMEIDQINGSCFQTVDTMGKYRMVQRKTHMLQDLSLDQGSKYEGMSLSCVAYNKKWHNH